MTRTATPVECARWLGVKDEDLEMVIEHPAFCRAMLDVRTAFDEWAEGDEDFVTVLGRSGLHPEQVFARHDLPVVDPEGLDVEKLRLELRVLSGSQGVVEERKLYGLSAGRLEKAEARVKELRLRAEQSINLLEGAIVALDRLDPTEDNRQAQERETARKRIEQAIENLRGGLEKSGGD